MIVVDIFSNYFNFFMLGIYLNIFVTMDRFQKATEHLQLLAIFEKKRFLL